MLLDRIIKETTDLSRVILDLSEWLDESEVVTQIISADISLGTTGWGLTPFPPNAPPPPYDPTPLLFHSFTMDETNRELIVFVKFGTPGNTYTCTFVLAGTSARQFTFELGVEISGTPPQRAYVPMPVNPPPGAFALPITGGTLQGPLYLFDNPPLYPTEAATKDYVDTTLGITGGPYLALRGGTLVGTLVLAHDPVGSMEAATKQYVDNFPSLHGFLPITGGSMTGLLTLFADPVHNLDAATKQYVDTQLNALEGPAGGDLGGNYPNPQVISTAGVPFAPSATSDTTNAANITSGNLALARFNGGSGATATTFWAGDATWKTVPPPPVTPATATVSDSPPSLVNGALWFDSVNTQLYIGYDDGSSVQWTSAVNLPTSAPPASGDLSGSYPNPLVVGLQGRAISNTAPTSGQSLAWNGTAWAPATVSGGGGLTDAPSDGTSYTRTSAAWANAPTFGVTKVGSGTQNALTITPGAAATNDITLAQSGNAFINLISTVGWRFQVSGGVSVLWAGGNGSYVRIAGSGTPQTMQFQNSAGGGTFWVQDQTSAAASVANALVVQNATTGNPAGFSTTGSDTNRSIRFTPAGTGTVQAPTVVLTDSSTAIATTAWVKGQNYSGGAVLGVTDGSNAATGYVGEYKELIANTIAAANTTALELALTAGDWQVWCYYAIAPSPAVTSVQIGLYRNGTTWVVSGTDPVSSGAVTINIYDRPDLGSSAIIAGWRGTWGPYRFNETAPVRFQFMATSITTAMCLGYKICARRMR